MRKALIVQDGWVISFPVVYGCHAANGQVELPVVWTKRWGHGRGFYSSLESRLLQALAG